MYDDLNTKLKALSEPTAFVLKTYEELLSENIELAKKILGENWQPLESDPYMKKLRVVTLRQLYNQNAKKESIKQLLITTATRSDLDNLGASLNIFRDLGEYPYANFEFKLLEVSNTDLIIPKGLVLNDDDDKYQARTINDTVIQKGSLSAIVKVELQEYISQTDIKTQNLITNLPFAIEIKQLDFFSNGSEIEDDDRYRLRIIKSNDNKTTAGSENSYKYFAFSSDSRIDDVSIDSPTPLKVDIYIASFDSEVDDVMIQRVDKTCNAKEIRPLGDLVSVYPAKIKEVNLKATIQLFDLLNQSNINDKIKSNLNTKFLINQDFTKSDFIRKCHIDGVYKVESDFKDIVTKPNEIIKIKSIELNFIGVNYE